jgi:hypothetical protein
MESDRPEIWVKDWQSAPSFGASGALTLDGVNVSPASAVDHFSVNSLVGRVSFLQTLNSKNFFGIQGGLKLKVGTLVRGLFNPTFFKFGIKPALIAGELPHFLKVGISALANTRLFPNLALDSVYRLPWVPAITCDDTHVRSILNKKMKTLSQLEILTIAESLFLYIEERYAGKKLEEGIISYLQGQKSLYQTYPFLNILTSGKDFQSDIKAGPFGKYQAARRAFSLAKLTYQPGVGLVYERVPQLSPEVLIENVMKDILHIMEIDQIPGVNRTVPEKLEKFLQKQTWLPWASVLVGCLATNQQDPLAVHVLLRRLTKKYRSLIQDLSCLEKVNLWLTVEAPSSNEGNQPTDLPASGT